MKQKDAKNKRRDIDDLYREALARPDLTVEAIDGMREHVRRLARTICDHVWGNAFY